MLLDLGHRHHRRRRLIVEHPPKLSRSGGRLHAISQSLRAAAASAFGPTGRTLRQHGAPWRQAQAAMVTTALTAMAMSTVLKKKDATPCPSVARRILGPTTWTSETWAVIPTTKE